MTRYLVANRQWLMIDDGNDIVLRHFELLVTQMNYGEQTTARLARANVRVDRRQDVCA